MAAPSSTVWGSIVTGSSSGRQGKLGIYTSVSNTDTQTTVNVQVWFWTIYSCSDGAANTLYYDTGTTATSATTVAASNIDITHTVATGTGWNTANQTKVLDKTYTHTRVTSDTTYKVYSKFSGIDMLNGTVYANTSYTVPALAYYTVSYDANGGSGAPSSQKKWYGKSLTLSTNKPTRAGYSFQGWATSASGSVAYASGASYTANAGATLYAVWEANTYTIQYDANGGSLGKVPTKEIKTYGVTLKISSEKPTRTNYNFIGWSTSKSATTAQYDPGDNYTTEASIIFYAVWQLAYTKPRIENFKAERCNQAGDYTEDGTCVHITASWTCDNPVVEVTASWNGENYGVCDVGGEGTAGFVDMVIGDDLISTEHAYDVSIYVRDGDDDYHSSTKTLTVTSYKFHIDFKPGTNPGVSVGKVAELNGVFDVALTSRFLGNHYCMSSTGEVGYTGYVHVAKIDIPDANADSPITFVLTRRTAATPMTVHIQFNYSETDDKFLPTITYEGSNYGAFLVHTNTSEWDLYVQKANAYDTITIQDWYTSKAMDSYISVAFPGALVIELPQGLDGWYRATPAVLRSIIDCIMPIGFVLTLYNHKDPNTMYPGTTWVRIQNAFLWGCDASERIGQTGGEKTHTLTVGEMPRHMHSFEVAHTSTGSITMSNDVVRYNKNTTSYAGQLWTNYDGNGEAHNNMPPYVHVSIWRREK